MEITINSMSDKIKQLKLKSIDLTQYKSWDHEQIYLWIMSLENGRYKSKYGDILKISLKEQEVDGDSQRYGTN